MKTPEIGQILYGNLQGGYGTPEYVDAFLTYIIWEIARIHDNSSGDRWNEIDDPGISGITWRGYWWGDENAEEAKLPNFVFEDVELRWYKHPCRSMYSNKKMSPGNWCNWFQRCLDKIRESEPDE